MDAEDLFDEPLLREDTPSSQASEQTGRHLMEQLRNALNEKESEGTTFQALQSKNRSKPQVAKSFFEMLVAGSKGKLRLEQNEPYGEIWIYPTNS